MTDVISIYALQRISDGAYLYVGSAQYPKMRFNQHRCGSPYEVIRNAVEHDDLRFVILTETDEEHRLEAESQIWQKLKDEGHPIVNLNPGAKRTPALTMPMSDETREQLKAIAQRLSNLGYDIQNPKHPDSISLSAVVRILAAMEYHARNIASGPSVRIE